jgi:hypothetical protein
MGDWDEDYDLMLDRYGEGQEEPQETRCRDCLSEDVYWALDRNGRWRLHDFRNSRLHVCNKTQLTEARCDAFDDLDT